MSTKVLPDTEVVWLVIFFSDCKLLDKQWRFGKLPYNRANPPPPVGLLTLFFLHIFQVLKR